MPLRLPPHDLNRTRLAKLLQRSTSDHDGEALAAAKAAARLVTRTGTSYEEILLAPQRRATALAKQVYDLKKRVTELEEEMKGATTESP